MWSYYTKLAEDNSPVPSVVQEITMLSQPYPIPLSMYTHPQIHRASVYLQSVPWGSSTFAAVMQRGTHCSCVTQLDFLEEDFVGIMNKGQWIVLPTTIGSTLLNIHLSPPVCFCHATDATMNL